jgi:TRAP-type uncharacterized transport system substrate-binding protein
MLEQGGTHEEVNEEIHMLGRGDLSTFDDLTDRRVAIGREASGTDLTARLLFSVSEVTPREMVTIDTEEALAELKAGRIDAMFYVAGYPVRLFTEGVTEADNLIPIVNKSVTEFYPRAEQYDCVRKYLQKAPPAPRSVASVPANPVMDAIKQVLGD